MTVNITIDSKLNDSGFQALSKEQRAAQRRQTQLRRLQARHEAAVTRELKEQIRDQQRLNRLTQKLNRDLEKQRKERSLTGRIGGVRGALQLGAGAVAFGQISQFRNEAIELAKIQEQAEAQLAARLRSTGGVAGFTAEQLKDYAAELQSVTNIGDESTIAAQAMLLSFTNIRENLPRTTKAVLDVATAMNSGATPSAEQLSSTAIQLGKALNDPKQGLQALRRVGVSFSDSQIALIKSLAEAGKEAEAQAVILQELERQYGGSAEAARKADGGAQALANSWGDLLENVGGLTRGTSQQNEGLSKFVDGVNSVIAPVLNWREVNSQLLKTQTESTGAIGDAVIGIASYIPGVTGLWGISARLAATDEELAAAQQAVNDKFSDSPIGNYADDMNDAADAAAELAKQQEEIAKRLERVNQTRFETASSLLELEDQLAEDFNELQKEALEEQLENRQDFNETILELHEDLAKDLAKVDKDLAKDIAKLEKSTAKDLQKINQKEAKDLQKLKEKQAKEDQNQERLKQIDVLADQRLFNLSLKHLAAEGNAIAIQQALERREIEEQIAKEKAVVEGQIEEQKKQDEIDRIKEAAQERRDSLREDRAERAQQLREDAEEERQLLKERLEEEKQEEKEAFIERSIELKAFNDEKKDELIKAKDQALATLGEELALAQDLTKTELQSLVEVAGKIGFDTGEAFAKGVEEGSKKVADIKNLLKNGPGTAGGAPVINPLIQQGLGFQDGGSFTVGGSGGPDSQLVAFAATPGERVTVTPQNQANSNITINASGPGIDQLVSILEMKVNEGLQEYTDTILVPALT